VFKLNTKQPISVHRVVPIPTTEAIIDTVNNIAKQEQQPEGVEFSDMHGRIALQDFADNDNDGDSNASDAGFELDEEYKEEVNDEIRPEKEDGSVGNDDPDLQEDYFQNPIQQHEASVRDNNDAVSAIIPRAKRGSDILVILLSDTATAETQKCGKQKKKKTVDHDTKIEEDLVVDDPMPTENSKPTAANDDITAKDDEVINELATPPELESDLGPYWTLAQSCQAYVLNTITLYSNIEASKSTPQYGFNRGLKEFGELGYEATVKELGDNLLGMGAVKMLKPSELNKNIRYEALS
jgi:hypothetical protein